ncbi:ShlB/FhaC/HecB family hemolysin secretion/activation protein [Oscillatoria laete-virens NRMC-F 0139]|nr:ShlB/FhaC/HecB family hemolysin secretion/activation protein [Oscillatoria laete-virens NRMC-F 0139]
MTRGSVGFFLIVLCLFPVFILAQARAATDTPAQNAQASFTLRSLAIKDHAGADMLWQEDFRVEWAGQPVDESRFNELLSGIHQRAMNEYGMVGALEVGPGTDLAKGHVEVVVTPFTIRQVQVRGNRWFSEKFIENALGLHAGRAMDRRSLDRAAEAENRLNNNASLKLSSLMDKVDARTMDVHVNARDRFPLRALASVTDPGNLQSDELRLGLGMRYDNLFGRGQLLGYNLGTTSRFDFDEAQSHSAFYLVPFYDSGDSFLLQASYSEANAAVVLDDLQFEGKGFQANTAYTLLLPRAWRIEHQMVFSSAYKRAENNLSLTGAPVQGTRTALLNFSLQYGAVLEDAGGITSLTVVGGGSPGDYVGDDDRAAYQAVRFGADPQYGTLVWGVGRSQKLPWEMNLNVSLSGQIASGPLLSTEQFALGGRSTVRGYNENQILADEGFLARTEMISPDLFRLAAVGEYGDLRPFVFFDYGTGELLDSQIGEDPSRDIASTGIGLRYRYQDYVSASVIFAQTLREDGAYDGNNRLLFEVALQY